MTPLEDWLLDNQTQVVHVLEQLQRHIHRPGPMLPLVAALNALPRMPEQKETPVAAGASATTV